MSAPIDAYTLIAQHRVAFKAWCDTSDEEWDTPTATAAGDLIDAAQEAMFNHRPATQDEARAKAAYMASCRTFTEWDNFDQVKLIEALTPAESSASNELQTAIDAFLDAKRTYYAAIEAGGDDEGPEWDAYEAAEHAVISYPCQTMEDARLKGRFFLDNAGPNDTLRHCVMGDEPVLNFLLRSLLGEGGAK